MATSDGDWLGVLASVGRSLWDRVTPDLRWVSVGLPEGRIVVRFAYVNEPKEVERERVSEAESEVIAEYHDLLLTDFQAVHRPSGTPRTLDDGTTWWAYMRHEADSA